MILNAQSTTKGPIRAIKQAGFQLRFESRKQKVANNTKEVPLPLPGKWFSVWKGPLSKKVFLLVLGALRSFSSLYK